MTAARPLILVFDSGLGGLTVFREIVNLMPGARYAYLADDAGFPYGRLADEMVIARVCEVLGRAIDTMAPDCVVIACNTASTLVLPPLRGTYRVPFVGTVPAVKPAARQSLTRRIAVLATPGTVSRDYTRDLVERFAKGCQVHLVGSAKLAGLAEDELSGKPAADADILAEIAPCFRSEDGAATDVVALACTHFPLILDRLTRLAPWPVTWLDPAPAIARRAADLLGHPEATPAPMPPDFSAHAFFTSNKRPAPPLVEALTRFGLRVSRVAEASAS